MHSASTTVEFFMAKAASAGQLVSSSTIQILVYFSQGWSLALLNKPMIKDPIVAGAKGPSIPSVSALLKQLNKEENLVYFKQETLSVNVEDEAAAELLHKIWQVYGSIQDEILSVMVTQPGTPWSTTREKYPEIEATISNELIKSSILAQMGLCQE